MNIEISITFRSYDQFMDNLILLRTAQFVLKSFLRKDRNQSFGIENYAEIFVKSLTDDEGEQDQIISIFLGLLSLVREQEKQGGDASNLNFTIVPIY